MVSDTSPISKAEIVDEIDTTVGQETIELCTNGKLANSHICYLHSIESIPLSSGTLVLY